MRPAISLFAALILLSSIAVGQQEPKVLSLDDLRELNDQLVALDEYLDNLFIYDEQRSAFEDAANKHAGQKVRLVVTVSHVTREKVLSEGMHQRLAKSHFIGVPRVPKIVFVNQAQLQQIAQLPRETIGRIEDWGDGPMSLNVGDVVDVEVAKRLRKGAQLAVVGEMVRVVVVGGRKGVLGFVIRDPQVEVLKQ